MILATVLGIFVALMLAGKVSTALFESKDNTPDTKTSLTAEIQPNAAGVRKSLSSSAPVILRINIDGIIGTESLTQQSVMQQLLESREGSFKNDRVKALFLVINTPGGGATASDNIYRTIKQYKELYKVPVYAYVDGLCASGGVYVACAADKIFASPASIIGSVGVVTPPALNVTALLTKLGVESKTLLAGKDKDELNPFRPWQPDEGANFQMVIDFLYDIFVNIVTTNRPVINKDKLIADYGAKIFPAFQAKEIGFIDDDNANYSKALAELAEKIEVKPDEYQVVTLKSENWLESLFKTKNAFEVLNGQMKHTIELPGQLPSELNGKFLYMWPH